MKSRLMAVAVGALLATGCVSLNTMQTANTVGKDKMQFALEPAFEGFSYKESTPAGEAAASMAVPRFDLALRYGVTERFDLGGRIGAGGFELQGKYQFTDPADKGFVMSLAPSVSGAYVSGEGTGVGFANISIPVLLGFGVGESQFVLGPKVVDMILFGGNDSADSSASVNILSVGTTIGFALKMGGFRLMPELGILYPLTGTSSVSSGGESMSATEALGGGVMYQIGLGFLFGGN